MLFTEKEIVGIEKEFIGAKERFKGKEAAFFDILENCNIEERVCLQYIYSFMPLSDIADYDGELILEFVRVALKTRKELNWGEKIPTEIFLHYVLCYRVNNENIEDYRGLFFEELYPRVKDKSMTEAALEVNYWCLQKAVYKSTDIRTASPLTVIRNGYGRCGEESTLLVSALRSVGIPARQCYVPRWAHCDDNHAWVEVWADGKWHYMGACEPEPILDTGWFDLASSKAMLAEVKAFGKGDITEEVLEQTAITSIINTLDHYAETKVLTVKVIDGGGTPIEGAKVRFELLNYSELYPIAVSLTDKEGKAAFKTGFGDIMIHVVKDGLFYIEKVDMRKQDELIVEWVNAKSVEKGEYEFDMMPPMIESIPEKVKSAEQNTKHEEKVQKAHEIRRAYEDTFYTEESAKSFAKDYAPYEKEVEDFLIKAKGNHQVITDYLVGDREIPLKYKVGILGTLKLKDYTDITLECLAEHMEASLMYKDWYEEDIFIENILAPRIHVEMITSYKQGILECFTEKEISKFRENPEHIITYIKESIGDSKDLDYPNLYTTPLGTLALKKGSLVARHILFVAICRAIGIPAHIQKVDGTIEYYRQGEWVNRTVAELEVEAPINAKLVLKKEQPGEWQYGTHYGLAKLEDGIYKTLHLYGETFSEENISYSMRAGNYRLITSNRQIDGTILAKAYHFEIEENEKKCIEVALRADDLHAHLKNVEVQIKELEALERTNNVVIWLELGKEPTEHILNEVRQQKERYAALDGDIIFLVENGQSLNDPTLQKTLKAVPNIKVQEVPNMEKLREKICRNFTIEVDQLPLATVITKNQKMKYACSGYNVGLADILLKIIDGLND